MLQSFIKPFYHDIKTLILDTLFPITCTLCETEGNFICKNCESELELVEFQMCIVCRRQSLGGLTHPKCQSPYSPDGLISFFNYKQENISVIIIKGKYSFLLGIYEELGKIIAQKLKTNFPDLLQTKNLFLVPIPLNFWRERWRGFNQSQILCSTMSLELNLPIHNVLIRPKNTKTQKDLKRDERINNIRSAFALSVEPKSPEIKVVGNNFLLVDDVTTTGSTLLEATKVLKRNGAKKVYCITVARD